MGGGGVNVRPLLEKRKKKTPELKLGDPKREFLLSPKMITLVPKGISKISDKMGWKAKQEQQVYRDRQGQPPLYQGAETKYSHGTQTGPQSEDPTSPRPKVNSAS